MTKERLPFIVSGHNLTPANGYVLKQMKARGYKTGDMVICTITKPRSLKFHGLIHQIGELMVDNIESFELLTGHQAIKRLQWESGVACDEVGAMVPGVGMVQIRIPKSISFESMDQGEFEESMKKICEYIADQYWPSLTPAQIVAMAEMMPL